MLRHVDVAEDIAFLAMELDKYGLVEESNYLVSSFVRKSGDEHLYKVLSFYKSYRAAVRTKVALFRISELEEEELSLLNDLLSEAMIYLKLAQYYLEF
jgi:aminoglycoside phosphotransferase family enzyme